VKIGVIGTGYVGKAVVECLGGDHELVVWDVADGRPYPQHQLEECGCAVVCVPTPPLDSGHADTAAVDEAVEALPCSRVLLKSTVPPGTTDRLRISTGKEICFWPEYIGESRYHNPFFATAIEEVPFVILGGETQIRRWFVDLLSTRLGPTKTYFQCTAIEAELAKYAENSYIAMKVTFVNEFRRIAEAFDADWHTVREAWLLDPRVEPMHTSAFLDEPGFSGKCLPKDVSAIIASATDAGYLPALLKQVVASNEAFKKASGDARR
jgi:UDPglucose 6-dehydrogenase